ncbi:beta-galactosidase trimerization domain-containing protein, partial [Cronobacter turicensis]
GIWAEEIDCLADGERNLIQGLAGNEAGLQGPYQVRHLCDLIHTEGATALATYRDDFYAGRAAVTVNAFGAGKAWYVASRNDLAFQRDFFGNIINELSLTRALAADFPPGVTAHARHDGESAFIFVENYTGAPQSVTLPEGCADMLTGDALSGRLSLAPWGCRILRRRLA